jgi:hypothetical protein
MIRLTVAMLGVLVALIGHDAHSPAAVVVGAAGVVPLLARLLTLPAAGRRAGFWLTAIVAGLVLAGCAAHQAGDTPHPPRPAPVACTVGVGR